MKPIKNIDQFRVILAKAKTQHEKQNLSNVSLPVLKNCESEQLKEKV
jgi:hypothetical protein